MSGYIAQYACLRHPERVSAMIIIGATGIGIGLQFASSTPRNQGRREF